ncbi:synaptobrevin [Colletotrichum chrysophilum]|uniref:Synaptobrevin homolog YKT6 n=1 Tax=Colletotrichum chrysophilum TaxID=1836956 RepID=A0AAD9B004_9PEZI|nr:synaptobrevin [Colletotrichum chrysophilum]
MKLHYIGILRNDSKPAVELCSEMELSAYSRFTRRLRRRQLCRVHDPLLQEGCRVYPSRPETGYRGGRQHVPLRGKERRHLRRVRRFVLCKVRRLTIRRSIISDHQYPSLVAHQLLSKIVDEFLTKHPRSTWATGEPKLALPELKEYLTKYQDPQQADSILKIQKELDETKIVLHKTIQSVLERGEKIDDLVAKSDGLSSQSKMFYQQAKKQNSCCVVM